MGVLLGIAGASFGVALSLGSGWFPKQYKRDLPWVLLWQATVDGCSPRCSPRGLRTALPGWQKVYGFVR